MAFALFKENQSDAPTLTRLYGIGVTEGLLTYYEKRDGRTYFIALLAQGECDGIEKVYYAGFDLPEFDSTGARNWRFHRGTKSTGFADAEQGRPDFFPNLDFTFSEKSYIEVALSRELSEGEDEPTRLKVIMRGCRVYDWTYNPALVWSDGIVSGVGGLVRSASKTYSVNNMRVFLDLCLEVGKMPLTRFHKHAQTAIAFRDRCDGGIAWVGGNVPVRPTFQNISNLTAYGDGGLKKTSGGTAWNAGASTVETVVTGQEGSFEVTVEGGTIKAGFTTNSAPTDQTHFELALQFNNNGILSAYKSGGANTVIGSWTPSDTFAFKIVAGAYVIEQNGGALSLAAIGGAPAVAASVRGAIVGFNADSSISRARIYSQGQSTRQIARYTAHLAYTSAVDLVTALNAVMMRCTGCSWYDINGGIGFFATPDRPVVHRFTFDPTQSLVKSNIVRDRFSKSPKPTEDLYNFYRWSYRNLDDPLITVAYEFTDRPALRGDGGDLNQTELVTWGVSTQSEVQRNGEAQCRLLTDLASGAIEIEGQADSYRVHKSCVVEVAHDVEGSTEDAPTQYLVVEEEFLPNTADDKRFILQPYNPAFYSDTDHTAIQPIVVPDIKSPFDAPPPIVSLDLEQAGRALPNGSYMPVIRALVTFAAAPYPQRARVWWKQPSEGALRLTSKEITPNPTTLQSSFELEGAVAGVHQIQVVTESKTGVKLPSNFHQVYEFEVEENVLPAPVDFAAQRIANTVVATWNPDSVEGIAPELTERYILRVRNATTNAIVREQVVDLPDFIPCKWTYYAGAGNQAFIHRDPDGTIECDTGHGALLSYRSQEFSGDSEVEWEVDSRHMWSVTVGDAATNFTTGVTVWNRAGVTPSDPMNVNAEGFDGDKRRLLPRTKLEIVIQNKQAEYRIDSKFWVRSAQLPLPDKFVLFALFPPDSTLSENLAMLHVQVRPFQPRQFVYTEEMQGKDFPLGIPATVKIEVAQISSLGVEGVSTAPITV